MNVRRFRKCESVVITETIPFDCLLSVGSESLHLLGFKAISIFSFYFSTYVGVLSRDTGRKCAQPPQRKYQGVSQLNHCKSVMLFYFSSTNHGAGLPVDCDCSVFRAFSSWTPPPPPLDHKDQRSLRANTTLGCDLLTANVYNTYTPVPFVAPNSVIACKLREIMYAFYFFLNIKILW